MMAKTSRGTAAMILSLLLGASSAAAQAGEFGTIEGDIARDGTLAPAGTIAIPDAGEAPSIGSVEIPAGEGFPTAGDNASIGESSDVFD
jgi:hypothetical protein